MKQADNYKTWSEAAKEYDRISGNDEWREDDASPHYDFKMIRLRLHELRKARRQNDVMQAVYYINEGLHGNLGRIASPGLYDHCFFGTKLLVNEYLDEVCNTLNWLCDVESSHFGLNNKLDFFSRTQAGFGQTALMLSGGAALGLFHMGVLKAMWEEKLLPKVISGSSTGSIMASMLATHTDDELDKVFNPEYLYVEAFRTMGWRGTIKGQGLLDPSQLEFCLERNVKEMTFEEAFAYTGRQVNITVSPADPHQESRLLNALTSPHVIVRRASLASCAIPFVYPPVMLWAKNMHGEKVPYISSRQWVDGSIKNDLPFLRLARLYGVNHTIVSQVNPHVVPFLSRKESERHLGSYLADMLTSNVQYNLSKTLEFAKNKLRHQGTALLLDKAQSIVSQRYLGDVNIVPPRRPSNIFRLISNASPADVADYIQMGEKSTWPKMELMRNSTCISRTIGQCLVRLKTEETQDLTSYAHSRRA